MRSSSARNPEVSRGLGPASRPGLGLAAVILLALAWPAGAEPLRPDAGPAAIAGAPPGPSADWSERERWVWDRIAASERADLAAYNEPQGVTSREPSCPAKPRCLSERFLIDILTSKPWNDNLTHRGIWISNALFDRDVDLSEVQSKLPIRLEWSEFAGELSLARSKLDETLSLAGSTVAGRLDMGGLKVGRDLVLNRSKLRADVRLGAAKIGGSLVIQGTDAIVGGMLEMGGIEVGGGVSMTPALGLGPDSSELGGPTFLSEVNLIEAQIGDRLEITRATFDRALNVDRTTIGQSFIIFKSHSFSSNNNEEKVDFSARNAKVGSSFEVHHSFFAGKSDFRSMETDHDLIFKESIFTYDVLLRGARIKGNLAIEGTSYLHSKLDMGGIQIEESLRIEPGSTFRGELSLVEADVGDSVSIGGAPTSFDGEVVILAAKVGSTFIIRPSHFSRELDMGGLEVGGSLFIEAGSRFDGNVMLVEVHVGDSLALRDSGDSTISTFKGIFNVDRAIIDQDFRLHQAVFELHDENDNVTIQDARISGTLDAGGSRFLGKVNLTGTKVGQLFAWPKDASNFVLHGLTYDRLPLLPEDVRYQRWYEDLKIWIDCNIIRECSPSFWVGWLNRDRRGSPQPYQQFAAVARAMGAEKLADEALYHGRDRELANATSDFGRLGLWALKYTIGYGVGGGYFRALWWIAGFTLIGALVLWSNGQRPADRFRWCLGASFDEILPLVELNDQHTKFINERIRGWRKVYFYVHRIAAYGLGLFVAAGLAGLTQGR